MSLDLSVPMSGTLDAPSLIRLTTDYYRQLLGLSHDVPLRLVELRAGRRGEQSPLAIDPDVDCGYLVEEVTAPEILVELGVVSGTFDLADRFPWATAVLEVSVRASEGEPRRLALGAAAAAAVACLCKSEVYDDLRIWSEKEFSSAKEFVEALHAPSVAQSVEDAVRNFRARMWNRGRR
jgi:hypothetical protein